LTSGFERAGEAYSSPDMKWIVFQATPKGEQHYQMYVARLKYEGGRVVLTTPLPRAGPRPGGWIAGTTAPVQVGPAGSRNTCGFFGPGGKSLIFASTAGKEDPGEQEPGYQRQGGNYRWAYPKGMEIYRCDDWLESVTATPTTRPTMKRLTDNDAYDAECAYSPDGKWIVFTSNRTGDLELYAMRPDGSGVVRLTDVKGYDGGPFFSPDGKRVVYRSDRKGNDLLQVFVADVVYDGRGDITGLKNERQLTDDGNVNWGPYWHPDGEHIAYATSRHGHQNYEIYLMRDDGTHQVRVTNREGFDGLPVFSPDGRYLMWSSKRAGDGTTQIFAGVFRMPEGE
jgi:hypothetical protein